MYAIGIDLGTTNSVAAVFRRGQKETIAIGGRYLLPSVVSFPNGQAPLVGNAAKARMFVDPERTVASVKRSMGDRSKTYYIQPNTYSPVDISAMILRALVDGAKKTLNQEIYDVVITVPAHFNDDQRLDTRRAAEQAGLNVLRLLPEPSAAALSYALNRGRQQQILVYDLGGGTFDVSILRVVGNEFEVVAVGGNSRLGGDDFDDAIIAWVAGEFEKKYGLNLLTAKGREYAMARQRLKEAAEEAKKELSVSDVADISVPEVGGHGLDVRLTLDKFNSLIAPRLAETIACVRRVLKDAKRTADDIDRVILVGGSTHVRAVRELVAKELKAPYAHENVAEAVAWGAAIQAAALSSPEEDLAPDITLREVTAHTLGIGLLDSEKRYVFRPLIRRNTKYPCDSGVLGLTVTPYQESVLIRVYRGENDDPAQNQHLGQLTLQLREKQPDCVPIGAVFDLDEDGILHFSAVEIPVGPAMDRRVVDLLESTQTDEGLLDTKLLKSLVDEGILPRPERVTIDVKAANGEVHQT